MRVVREWSPRYQVEVAEYERLRNGDKIIAGWRFVGSRDELPDAEALAVEIAEEHQRVRIVDTQAES